MPDNALMPRAGSRALHPARPSRSNDAPLLPRRDQTYGATRGSDRGRSLSGSSWTTACYQEVPLMVPGSAHGALLVAYRVPVAVLSWSQKHLPEPLWAPTTTVSLVVVTVVAWR